MLAMSVRDRPCNDLDSRSSSGRATERAPSSPRFTVIGSATVWLRVPFGPLTVTCWPSIVTSTPAGTEIGIFPMRLIWQLLSQPDRHSGSSLPLSPDVGED